MQDGKTPVNLARSKVAFTVQVVKHQNKQVTAIKILCSMNTIVT